MEHIVETSNRRAASLGQTGLGGRGGLHRLVGGHGRGGHGLPPSKERSLAQDLGRRPRAAAVVLALGAVVAAGVLGCSGRGGGTAESQAAAAPSPADDPGQDPPALAVTVEEAKEAQQALGRPIQREVQFVGNFVGFDEVTVMAEVTGRVVEVCRDVGDVVRPGDVLLKIDPTDYRLALEETWRAVELEAARIGIECPPVANFTPGTVDAVLRDAEQRLSTLDINKLAPVLRAQEQEENAKRKMERAKRLREQNIISEEAYDQASTDYEVARTTRVQTELDAKAVVAAIKHRLVLLQIADQKLRRTQVVVPTPTRRQGLPETVEYAVARRRITEGEMLKDAPGSSTAVFDLVIDTVLKLVASVPERFLGEVAVGQNVEVREAEAYPGGVFRGKVARISPVVDRVKHSFEIEALIPNPRRELKPGGYAKGAVLTREDPRAVMVPKSALVTLVGSTRVYVIRDGKAHAVPVNPGVELVVGEDPASPGPKGAAGAVPRRAWVELVKPDPDEIRPGTTVITSVPAQLAEGSPVTIRQPEP